MPDYTAHHVNDKTATRFIIVKETREISSGRSQNGREYSMWQIIATKPDGAVIDQNLRSFEDLPRGEVLEVSVTPFVSEQWGTSYTVARKNKSKLHSDFELLSARVAALEKHLGLAAPEEPQGVRAHQGPPPPPTADGSPPPIPVIVAPDGRKGDDTIPF